jgi:hypothetical protein
MALVLSRPRPNLRFNYTSDVQIVIRHRPGPKSNDRTSLVHLLNLLTTEVKTVVDIVVAAVQS